MRTVEIDRNSGFCPGVIRVVDKAEEYLDRNGHLYSLGAIVHNEEELGRLQAKGLVTIDDDDIDQTPGANGESLLIRAHGEPPELFEKAERLGFDVIDCTCPVVLKLQGDIREAYARVHPAGGKIFIYGKIGHAEVLGLVGQVGGDAIVVENIGQLKAYLDANGVKGPVELFSQTTMDPDSYAELHAFLESRIPGTTVHETICAQVSSRHKRLMEFSLSHDIIIFVSGKSSSNGKVLCDLCRSYNLRTYHIGSVEDIQKEWFSENDKVGVCGATSTPKWLLENVAAAIENLQ